MSTNIANGLRTMALTVLIALVGSAAAPALAAPPPLSVQGNKLLAAGSPTQLRGVNYLFLATNCDYTDPEPADVPATFAAMKSWAVNTVRLGVNAYCWLGSNGAPSNGYDSAATYRATVRQRVTQLEAEGFWVVLVPQNTDWLPDPRITSFWKSAAATFAADHSLIFDLVGEVALDESAKPNDGQRDVAGDPDPSTDPWACWMAGCTINSVHGGHFESAGMQTLVDAVRGTGATQPIMVGSLEYDSQIDQWQSHVPNDPAHALMLDQHRYDFVDGDGSGGSAGFASFDRFLANQLAPIARRYPTVFGELGEIHCDDPSAGYSTHVLRQIDALQASEGTTVSAIGWEWRVPLPGYYACPTGNPPGSNGPGGPLLLNDYNGTPTAEGRAFKDWFTARASAGGEATLSAIHVQRRKHGTLVLSVTVSGRGELVVRGRSKALLRRVVSGSGSYRQTRHLPLLYRRASANATGAQQLTLTLHPSAAAREYLKRHLRMPVILKLTFRPSSGSPISRLIGATARES